MVHVGPDCSQNALRAYPGAIGGSAIAYVFPGVFYARALALASDPPAVLDPGEEGQQSQGRGGERCRALLLATLGGTVGLICSAVIISGLLKNS